MFTDDTTTDSAPPDGEETTDAPRGAVMVYRYGLLPPVEGADRVSEQLFLAHRYRNTLVEIERGLRAALRDMEERFGLRPAFVAVNEAKARTALAATQLKAARAKTRTRAASKELTDALRDARAAEKAAKQAFSAKRAELRDDPAMLAERERLQELANELKKSARKHCNVFWGTYQLVEDAMRESAKMPLYDGAEPNDPHFARWGDAARQSISVQLQGGMDVADVAGNDTRFRIGPAIVPPSELARWERKRIRLGDPNWMPREGKAQLRRTLYIRIGSNDDRSPVWASFPMIMHRPLPVGAVIKRATVSKKMIGPREEWSTTITIVLPHGHRREPCGEGAVAVNLGWRVREDALRVATFRGHDMPVGEEFTLDAYRIAGLRKASGIAAVRDKNFDAIRVVLTEAFRAFGELPEWIRKDVASLGKWKSPDRLQRLVTHWKTHRWTGDDAIYATVETWRYRDHHLWEYERGQCVGSLRARRDYYRNFAAMLARRYGVLVLADEDLRDLARVPAAEDEDGGIASTRSNRQLAAPSELRTALMQAFAARGGEAVRLPAGNKTRTCNACGVVNTFDAVKELRHVCSACKVEWDIDDNHDANLLAEYRERCGDAAKAGIARGDGKRNGSAGNGAGKWAKLKADKAAKKAGDGTARRGDA